MKNLVYDCETNGLLDDIHTIHCLVLRDIDSERIISCSDDPGWQGHSLSTGLHVLKHAERAYGHNSISFDLPALQKVYPKFTLRGYHGDTMVVAAMRWAHIKEEDFKRGWHRRGLGWMCGSHSLKAWGYRLGLHKGEYKGGWEKWSPEMQAYCEQDTAVTKELLLRIRKSPPPAEAIETELELADYLAKMERNGWPFDVAKAQELQGVLAAKRSILEAQLQEFFPPWEESQGIFTPKVTLPKRGYKKGVPLERFKTIEFNPSSTQHIANRLIELYGWQPTEYTEPTPAYPRGQIKVDENTLAGLTYEPVPVLQEYLLVAKRLSQLSEGKEAWLHHTKTDKQYGGRITGLTHIHGKVWASGCVTHRASHSKPNLGQVPKNDSPYGVECRSLFTVPKGWVELGADASGLELRCLAHYMALYDDGAFGATILAEKPNDIHSLNASILGCSRDDAKTFIYAFLYGAGDEKLGKILAPGKTPQQHQRIGKRARAKFLGALPALGDLLHAVKLSANARGYLQLIDGRRTYIRSEHAALNSLLQGTGSIVCKRWIVEASRRLVVAHGQQGWGGSWAALGWIHDEVALAVKKPAVKSVTAIVLASLRSMTEHFDFRVPLDGEAKIGQNWAQTH